MRGIVAGCVGCLACVLLPIACNSVLNNQAGDLVDAGGGGLEDASVQQDTSVVSPPEVDAAAPPTVTPDSAAPIMQDSGTVPSCGFGQKLCNGACVSVNDPLFGCGPTTCAPCALENATATCAGNGCAVQACAPGYAECAGSDAGCATSLADPSHCGACNAICATTAPYCAPTSPTSGLFGCTNECPPTASTLCGDECVDLSSSINDCGACGSPCPSTANGVATCASGHCGFTCDADFHACGAACVSDLDPATCGSSCSPCPAGPNAVATCDGTQCGTECQSGFANCDGNAANGCEANLASDPTDCGQCGISCDGRACLSGACAPPPDAGSPPADAGSPPADAGSPPVDAGQVAPDSGDTSDGGLAD